MPLLERPIGIILLLCIAWLVWTGIKRTKQYYAEQAALEDGENISAE